MSVPIWIMVRMLAKIAQEFEDTALTVEKNGKQARLDRVLMLMGLGVKNGDEITVSADGKHENEAADRVKLFLQENL